MSVIVLPGHQRKIPPVWAKAVLEHPLCPKFGYVMNGGWRDLTGRARGQVISAGTTQGLWSPARSSVSGLASGMPGVVREHNATTDLDRIVQDAATMLPTSNVTIVIGNLHIATGGVHFGGEVTSTAAFVFSTYLPFTDNVTYFDWGGQTNGATRVQVGGLTFGDDIWVMSTGPRGMELWQNGILRASNGANPTRSQWGVGTETLCWGKNGFGSVSGLWQCKFTFIYWNQLPTTDILRISREPFCWVDQEYNMGRADQFTGTNFITHQMSLPYESLEAGLILRSNGLPYEAKGVLTHNDPLPYEGKGRAVTRMFVPIEIIGETAGSTTAVFDIMQPVASPVIAYFDVSQVIPTLTPIEATFDIIDGANALMVSFDIVDQALIGARSQDIQMPVAEVHQL